MRALLEFTLRASLLAAAAWLPAAGPLRAADSDYFNCAPVPDRAAQQHCGFIRDGVTIDVPSSMTVSADKDGMIMALDEKSLVLLFLKGDKRGAGDKPADPEQMDVLIRNAQFPGIENTVVGKSEPLMIDGMAGKLFSISGRSDGIRMKLLMGIVVGDDRTLLIGGAGPESTFLKSAKIIRQCIASVRKAPFPEVIPESPQDYQLLSDAKERFELHAPKSWKVTTTNKAALIEAQSGGGDAGLLLIADYKSDLTMKGLPDYAHTLTERMKAKFPDGALEGPVKITVNDGDVTRYRLTGSKGEIKLDYDLNFFQDSEYYYQVILFTVPSKKPEYQPVFEAILGSFNRTKKKR